jgi:hypothetical protein
MGRRTTRQGQLFYAFALDDVPASHLVRKIDAVLDLSWVHQELAPFATSRRLLIRSVSSALRSSGARKVARPRLPTRHGTRSGCLT